MASLNMSVPKTDVPSDSFRSQRVFKKSSPNSKLTLYLSSRDLVVTEGRIDRLQGVLLVDPEFVDNRKVYGQITLTFRYGREDEEVMGLKFCNEAIMCLAQLYPPHPDQPAESNTPLQDALLKRLGPNAYPFSLEITPLAPPSVQLVPAKEYNGAPIGTSYDLRAYVTERPDEKLHRRTTVRMGIRVVQRAYAPPSPELYIPGGKPSKDRTKQNKKGLPFVCKSVILETKFPKSPQEKSQSVEAIGVENKTSCKMEIDEDTANENVTNVEEGNKENCPEIEDEMTTDNLTEKETTQSNGTTEVNNKEDSVNEEQENEEQSVSPSKDQEKSPDREITQCANEKHFQSMCGSKRPSLAAYLAELPAPRASVGKHFMLSHGKVHVTASLDKAIYAHGEEIYVNVHIRNNSNKTVRRIKVFVVQHVDVCMFTNGKFKNVVAMINTKNDCPVTSNSNLEKTFTLLPIKSPTKNWIALEDSYTKTGTSLASTVTSTANNPNERNVFAIYVSYYVKVKLLVSVIGGHVSLKLPFTLMHTCSEYEHTTALTEVSKPEDDAEVKSTAQESIKPEKDGT